MMSIATSTTALEKLAATLPSMNATIPITGVADAMKTTSDAIIIGAGVIGAATAFELCKRGYQTLNIDKLPAAGYGPTSSSCSIVRAHYSSWDGVAMAHEGFSYWQDWPNYLEIDADGHEIAKYMQCGTVLLKSKTGHHEKVLEHFRNLGVDA